MGRIIRRVPVRWKHKQRIKNQYHPEGYRVEIQYRPMRQGDFKEAVKNFKEDVSHWLKGWELWQKGFYKSYDGKILTKQEAYKQWLESIEGDRKRYNFRSDYREEERKKYELDICNYEDIEGETPRYPDPDDYMPEGKWYQLFENVTEGTPLSPPFKTPQQLVDWLTNNKDFWGEQWTKEQAEAMLKDEYSPSFVMTGGKLYNSREALTIKKVSPDQKESE